MSAGPYAAAAWDYRNAAWLGVIPIGRRPAQKSPPPTGYTGWAGIDPSGADIQAWIDGRHGAYNVALHLPPDGYVLDVDEAQLAELEARVGSRLPRTWSNTAQGPDDPRRQYWFRATLPPGRVWRDHPMEGMDSLHVGHRYGVVAPSVHPSGQIYCWYVPSGVLADRVPKLDDFAELPAEWVEACSHEGTPLEGSAAGDEETRGYLSAMRRGEPCPRVAKQLGAELNRMAAIVAGTSVAGLHDPGPLLALTAFGLEGHVGVPDALRTHHDAYVDARVRLRNESEGTAGADWWRMVRGAAGKWLRKNGGEIVAACRCGEVPPEIRAVSYDDELGGVEMVSTTTTTPAPVPDLDAARTELAAIDDASARRNLAREFATEVLAAGLPVSELQTWREMLCDVAGLSGRQFDELHAEARRAAKAERRAERDPGKQAEGPKLSNPGAPVWVARELVKVLPSSDAMPHLTWWRGDFYWWAGTHWSVLELSAVQNWLYRQTADAYYVVEGKEGEQESKYWHPTAAKINALTDALGKGVLHRSGEGERWIATQNGVLWPAGRQLAAHTPKRFNLYSLPFAYDASAACPAWLAFLESTLPGDVEAHALLAEWFGYVVSGRTDLEKILALTGPTRCGKGTTYKVLRALLGPESVTSPSLAKLGGQFGEQSLIGKRLAVFSDADWKSRDAQASVEVLKAISGTDPRTVPRKNREDWEGVLDVRFMVMANEMPSFIDPSGALAGRLLHVEFRRSFLGREDGTLQGRLLAELPGILNWALDGLDALIARGGFTQPVSSAEIARETSRQSSPVLAFVEDLYERAAYTISVDALYADYRNWCVEQGRDHPGTKPSFARSLRSALGDRIEWPPVTRANGRVQMVVGLRRLEPVASFGRAT
jgi:putative DNA primase/helicase